MKQRSTVVWLRTRVGTLTKRVGSGKGRPLLSGDATRNLAEIEKVRRTLYSSVADVIVDTDGLTPDVVADRVTAKLRGSSIPRADTPRADMPRADMP